MIIKNPARKKKYNINRVTDLGNTNPMLAERRYCSNRSKVASREEDEYDDG